MADVVPTQAALTLVYTFTYRGEAEDASCTFHFGPDYPPTDARWKALADAVITDFAACLPSTAAVVKAIGHKGGDVVAVWSYDYGAHSESVAGTLVHTDGEQSPGDSALWVRWPTDLRTSRGKPIYLRNYIHPAFWDGLTGGPDKSFPGQVTALENLGEAWVSGYSDGTALYERRGPYGVVGLTGCIASPWVTTRTLERRGKRP